MNIPEDILFEIMKNFECIEDLSSFCLISKRHYSIYINRMDSILKHYLEYFKVDYIDPTNFIYVANEVECKNYYNELEDVISKVNYQGIFKLYMEFYYYKEIRCYEKIKITSFPIYPNMEIFYGYYNLLTIFPVQPNMTHFDGENNQLTSFPVQPNMLFFFGGYNQLTSFEVQPEMIYFNGDGNQLTSFPVQPKMTHFCGTSNPLTSLSDQPKMTHSS